MNRDTMMARWYRRVDSDCFTSLLPVSGAADRPAMEVSTGTLPEPETAVYATTVSDHWPSVSGDRRGWTIEAVADRL